MRKTLQSSILVTSLKDNLILVSGGTFALCAYFFSIGNLNMSNFLNFGSLGIIVQGLSKSVNNSSINSQDGQARQNLKTCETFYEELLKKEKIKSNTSSFLNYLTSNKQNPIYEYTQFYIENHGININEILTFSTNWNKIYESMSKNKEEVVWNKETAEKLYTEKFEEYIEVISEICKLIPDCKYDFAYNIADIFVNDIAISKNKVYCVFYCLFKLYEIINDEDFAIICSKTLLIIFVDITNFKSAIDILGDVLLENKFKFSKILKDIT